MRGLVGRLYAFYYRWRSLGRMRGGPFIIRRPSLVRISRGASVRIGQGVVIEKGARIVCRAELVLEDNVYVGKNSTIVAFSNVKLGQGSMLGENASVHSEDHGPAGNRMNYTSAPVTIGEDVWIGAGAVVTKGCNIEAGATIGANAVVTRDIPANVVAVGVPARPIGPSKQGVR